MALDVKQILQEIVVPELKEIKSEQAAIKVEIKRLDEKIDNLDKRLNEKIQNLDEKIDTVSKHLNDKMDSLRNEFSARFVSMDARFESMDARFGSLEREISLAINIHERIATIEAKLASMR
jgi:peptidoglycan hydrolase CwlO-like protein